MKYLLGLSIVLTALNTSLCAKQGVAFYETTFVEDVLDFFGKESTGTPNLSLENKKVIEQVQQEVDVSRVSIRKMQPSAWRSKKNANIFCFPISRYLFVFQPWFDSLPDHEKRAIAGRELIYIKKGYAFRKIAAFLVTVGIPAIISYLAVNTIKKISRRRYFDPIDFSDLVSMSDKRNEILNKALFTLGGTAIGTALFWPFYAWYCRHIERVADEACGEELQAARSLLAVLKRIRSETKDEQSRFTIKYLLHKHNKFHHVLLYLIEKLIKTKPSLKNRIINLIPYALAEESSADDNRESESEIENIDEEN